MIRRLRDRHRWMIPVIAFLVALALVFAWSARQQRQTGIPAVLQPHAEDR